MAYPTQSPIPSTSHFVAAADQLPLPPDQEAPCSAEAGTFETRHTTIALSERLQLKNQGYSDRDISAAEKTLLQRATEPLTVDRILQELADRCVDITSILNSLDEAIDKTPGTTGKGRLASQVMDFAKSLKKRVACEFKDHFTAGWPERQKVAEIVSQWPESLKESATYIRYGWPVLKVGRDVDVLCDFRSAIKVCSSRDDQYPGLHPRVHPDLPACFDPEEYKHLSQSEFKSFFGKRSRKMQALIKSLPSDFPVISQNVYLDYPVFFRLVRDIWLDALHNRNTETMNRISHLMVSFTQQINSSYEGKRDYLKPLDVQLGCIHLLKYDDLSVLAFLLVTHPRRWEENYKPIFQQLIRYAFSNQESKLKTNSGMWGADLHQQLSISRWAESEVIPDTVTTLRFLRDIVQYIDKHKHLSGSDMSGHISPSDYHWSERLSRGQYFDKETHQLLSPITVSDPQTLFPLEETRKVLADFYSTSFGTTGAVSANSGNAR